MVASFSSSEPLSLRPPREEPDRTGPTRRAPKRAGPKTSPIEDEVDRSIETIERAVETFAAMRDNVGFYKELAGDLRRELHEERARRSELAQRLSGLEHLIEVERKRAAAAEERAAQAERTIGDLERRIDALHDQTARLVRTVTGLVADDEGVAA